MQDLGVRDFKSFQSLGAIQTCPVCPQPGINLPDDWRNHKYKYEIIYILLMIKKTEID